MFAGLLPPFRTQVYFRPLRVTSSAFSISYATHRYTSLIVRPSRIVRHAAEKGRQAQGEEACGRQGEAVVLHSGYSTVADVYLPALEDLWHEECTSSSKYDFMHGS